MWTSTRFIRRIWPGSENLLEQRKAPTIAGYLGKLDGMHAWDSLGCLALMLLWCFSLSVVLRASLLSIFMFSLWWLRASAFTSLALGHYHSHCSHTFHNHLSEVVVKDQTALLSLSCLLYSFWSERPVFCHSWGSIADFLLPWCSVTCASVNSFRWNYLIHRPSVFEWTSFSLHGNVWE